MLPLAAPLPMVIIIDAAAMLIDFRACAMLLATP